MPRYYFFDQGEEGPIGLSAENILWMEEIDPAEGIDGKGIGQLKAVFQRNGSETVVRSTLNHLVPMEDFRHWLALTLPSGKRVQVNPEKIEDLKHMPGGTDIRFAASKDNSEGQILFVTETPAQIHEQLNFDPSKQFSELLAENAVSDAQLFSRAGFTPDGVKPLDKPEPP